MKSIVHRLSIVSCIDFISPTCTVRSYLPYRVDTQQYMMWNRNTRVYYRVAQAHRMPYLYRSFSAKEPYIQRLFCKIEPLYRFCIYQTGRYEIKTLALFHKRATKYRALLQKMTYKDKASCGSSPTCI